jgi:hypothetical protein
MVLQDLCPLFNQTNARLTRRCFFSPHEQGFASSHQTPVVGIGAMEPDGVKRGIQAKASPIPTEKDKRESQKEYDYCPLGFSEKIWRTVRSALHP